MSVVSPPLHRFFAHGVDGVYDRRSIVENPHRFPLRGTGDPTGVLSQPSDLLPSSSLNRPLGALRTYIKCNSRGRRNKCGICYHRLTMHRLPLVLCFQPLCWRSHSFSVCADRQAGRSRGDTTIRSGLRLVRRVGYACTAAAPAKGPRLLDAPWVVFLRRVSSVRRIFLTPTFANTGSPTVFVPEGPVLLPSPQPLENNAAVCNT